VSLTLREANPAEREIIAASLGNVDTSESALAQVIAIMERHNAFGRSVEQARAHVGRARAALAGVPQSEMRNILSDIAEFYVSRAY